MAKKRSRFTGTVVIDTREQHPYHFDCATVVETLDAGDYSIKGMEVDVAIERKTKEDVFGSVTRGRDRFEREMIRLQGIRYAAIVVEASLEGLLVAPGFSHVNPKVVINTLVSWSIKYKVHVWMAGNRLLAARLTYRLLEKAWQAKVDS